MKQGTPKTNHIRQDMSCFLCERKANLLHREKNYCNECIDSNASLLAEVQEDGEDTARKFGV